MSAYGFQYADFCAQMIRREYGFYLKEVVAMEFTQVQSDPLDGVELLINDLKSDIIERVMEQHPKLTSLRMGFVVPGKRNIRKLDEWLAAKRKEELAALTFEGTLSVASVDELPSAIVDELHKSLESVKGERSDGNAKEQNDGYAIDWDIIADELSNRLYYEALQLRNDVIFLTAQVPDALVGVWSYAIDNELLWDGKRRNQIICCLYNDRDFRKLLRMEEILQELAH